MFKTISNNKIILEKYKLTDAALIFQAIEYSRNEISAWLSWLTPDYDLQNAESFTQIQMDNWKSNSEYAYTIKDFSGNLLGVIGLHMFDSQNDVANIGYWMNTKYAGKGICTQALSLLVENSLKPLNLIRIEVIVAINNIASQRVVEKAGGIYEATLRNRLRLDGSAIDAKIFSFTI